MGLLSSEELKQLLPAETRLFLRRSVGPADGQVKRAILGDNNARLHNFTPKQRSALQNDRFAQIKENYKKDGEGRSNRTYGYILKSTALSVLRNHDGTVVRCRSSGPLMRMIGADPQNRVQKAL